MRIDEYLDAYERYRDTVWSMGRTMRFMASKMEKGSAHFLKGSAGEIVDFVDYDELKREYERKKRILGRATKRLQRAISRVHDVRYSSYLTSRYLYAMKNDEIADSFNYCQRQIYRISYAAKTHLYHKLLEEMPCPRKTKSPKKYRKAPSGALKRRYRRHYGGIRSYK